MDINEKYNLLRKMVKEMGQVCVAFSGGVDSTFLLKVCNEVLGNNVLAITATSSTYPEREKREATEYAMEFHVEHLLINSEEFEIPGFANNSKDRCYYCKSELMKKISNICKERNIKYILDGANTDDIGDFRPGMKAARELGVISPIKDADLSKAEVRELSKKLGLKTWDKPSYACLATRIPYGEVITKDKLSMIDRAEQFLMDCGLKQVRVRHHGEIARIEVAPSDRKEFFSEGFMDTIAKKLREIGFTYITLDLLGYRTGSMNEVLSDDEKQI